MDLTLSAIRKRHLIPGILTVLIWVWIQRPALAQNSSGHENSISSEKISLDLNSVSMVNALRMITERLGKNVIIHSGVQDKPLKMYLTDIKPFDAFKAIIQAEGLGYRELEGNIFYITHAKKFEAQTIITSISCKYADATKLEALLKSIVVSESGSVMADKRTNTLIIRESPQVISRIKKIVEELDRPVQQVYIQAEIVEASSINDKQVGVEWLWDNANYKSIDGAIGTDFGLQARQQQSGNDGDTEIIPRTRNDVSLPIGQGLGIGILNTDVRAVINALSEVTKVNLLSRPRIVTMDNQEATIEVGDQIPFKVLNEFGVTSFEFKDATIQLIVKPHIIDSDNIILEVSPKADFQNGTTSDGTPIIATRKASTKVKIKNGQTLVIGGLMRDSQTETQSKVPILGDIPLLGMLFKSSKKKYIKTELLVFITPTILKDETGVDLFQKDFEFKERIEKKLK